MVLRYSGSFKFTIFQIIQITTLINHKGASSFQLSSKYHYCQYMHNGWKLFQLTSVLVVVVLVIDDDDGNVAISNSSISIFISILEYLNTSRERRLWRGLRDRYRRFGLREWRRGDRSRLCFLRLCCSWCVLVNSAVFQV